MKKHANQVAAWGKLSGLVHELGDSFNPSKESMKRTALDDLLNDSQKSVEAVHIAESALTHAVNIRDHYIRQLPKIGQRIMGALEAIDAPIETLHDVNRLRKRLSYQALPKAGTAQKKGSRGPAEIAGKQGELAATAETSIAVNGKRQQLDIESKVDNFTLLIQTVGDVPEYANSKNGITIDELRAFLKELKDIHQEANDAYANIQQARGKRDELLYGKQGIHGKSRMVKGYLRSEFGPDSGAFKSAKQIKFQKK